MASQVNACVVANMWTWNFTSATCICTHGFGLLRLRHVFYWGLIWYCCRNPRWLVIWQNQWNWKFDVILMNIKRLCLQLSGVFCRSKLLSRYCRTHRPQAYANYCLAIRTVVCPSKDKGGQPASYCLLFSDNESVLWLARFTTSSLLLSICTTLYIVHCVGDVMPARSE
jgi:hypothetical protein